MPQAPSGASMVTRAKAPATTLRARRPDVSRVAPTEYVLIISSSCRCKTDPCDREKAEGEHEPMHCRRPALARSISNASAHLRLPGAVSFLSPGCDGPGRVRPGRGSI